MKRVVVTGLGMISPLANNVEESWERLLNGECGILKIQSYDASEMPVQIAAEVKDFNPMDFGIEKKEVKKLARNTQFAIAASKMALEDSGLSLETMNPFDIGVVISSGIGGMEIFEEQHKNMLDKGIKRISPFTIPAMISNMAAGNVAIYLGLQGPNKSVVTACASGTNSIGEAFEEIKLGKAKVMLAGGTEAAITSFAQNAFANMKALSDTHNEEPQKASRPFSKDRDGFVMGEGAGILVLEELEHAKARGAKIYAEMVGYGSSCDAYHITAPYESGAAAAHAMTMAMEEAGVKPEEVQYINAHGTSTPANDKTETRAIKVAFGEEQAKKLWISSTKGALGHGLGAAGGLEGVILAKVLETGMVPPTINYETPDEECDLDYVPNVKREGDIQAAMSNSLGFGGHNAVILMKKYQA